MYDVTLHNGDNELLIHDHRAASNAQKLTTASITDAVNSISAFKFEINPANIGYDQITEFGTIVKVWNSKRGRYDFIGRVLQIDPQMDDDGMMYKTVMCEDRLSFLHDSIQPFMAKKHFKGDASRSGLEEFIDLLLDAHNSQVEEYKHIHRGRVTVDPFKTSDSVTKGLDWETTYEAIAEKLINSFGGYIVLREEGGLLYLDYLESVGETRNTPIEVGYNMSSVRREINTGEIATRIVPLGYKYSSEDSDSTDERLTIASVNDGVIYVESAELVAKYGIRYAVVIFDDVTEPGNLMRKGLEHFTENGGLTVSHDVSALELSLILDVDDIVIYDSYPVRNVALGINETLQIVKKTTDVIEPYNSTFEMGDIKKRMSDVMVGTAGSLNSIQREVKQVGERVTKTEIQIVEATNELTTRINDTTTVLGKEIEANSTEIKQLSNSIQSTVTRKEFNDLGEQVADNSSKITQTATAIRSEVADEVAGVKSQIEQTASSIRSEVAEDIEGLDSKIEQTATSIRAEVSDEVEALSGRIDVQANKVELAVNRSVGGTNLVSCAEGSIWVQTGEIHDEWAADYYNRSGVGVVMTPWSGSHNEIRFQTDIDVRPGEYTLSFYSWYTYLTTNISIRLNLLSNDPNVSADIYFDEHAFMPPPSTPTKHSFVLNVNHKGKVILRFVTMTPWSVGNVFFSDVKLEKGNTATDWSPYPGDPSEGLDTGTDGGVQVTITKERFNVNVPGEDGDFELNETGGSLPVLRSRHVEAPNLAYAYDGPAVITINPAATSEEIASGGVYRSLPEAFAALNNRQLAYDVTINVMGDSYGFEELYGVHGSPNGLTINGNGHTLTGRFRASNCSTNIMIDKLMIVYDSAYGKDYTANFDNCSHVNLNGCVINGSELAARGVWFAWATRAYLSDCEFYKITDSAIKAGDNVDLLVMNAKGNVPYFVWADGAVIKWAGTRPSGQYWEGLPSICNTNLSALTVNTGSSAESVTVTTKSWPMLYADTYAGGYENSWNYQSHDDVMQGYTEHAGRIFGCIWFDNASIRAAGITTVRRATIRLKAQTYVGRGVAVDVHLWGTATEYAGRSGAPALTVDYGVIGTAAPGEITTISIPTRAAADLASGAINGLMLYSDDAALYKNRNYSQNYMRFDGGTSGDSSTRPELTVTYGGGSNVLTVMTCNVQSFTGISARSNILNTIFAKYSPDIVGFQEYYNNNMADGTLALDYLKRHWANVNVVQQNALATHLTPDDEIFGYDYKAQGAYHRSYMRTYVTVGGKRIAVFNTHLEYDYEGLSSTPKCQQMAELMEAVKNEEYFIVTGDFNTCCKSTSDPDYINMLKMFVDAGYNLANNTEERGFNWTWTNGTTETNGTMADGSLGWEETDNIITSANIKIQRVVIDKTKISAGTGLTIDHLPLIARLEIE